MPVRAAKARTTQMTSAVTKAAHATSIHRMATKAMLLQTTAAREREALRTATVMRRQTSRGPRVENKEMGSGS
ncbi:unnamed protein product [Linum trigynum]|uniref:Uncharacterized protein n=1 Tax=Linum trigynum TaxID=586398 RepID=A0AAV2DTL4_9ROSI